MVIFRVEQQFSQFPQVNLSQFIDHRVFEDFLYPFSRLKIRLFELMAEMESLLWFADVVDALKSRCEQKILYKNLRFYFVLVSWSFK